MFFFLLPLRRAQSTALIKVLHSDEQVDVCNLSPESNRLWTDIWSSRERRQCRSATLLCHDDRPRSHHVSARNRFLAVVWDSILQAFEWDSQRITTNCKHCTSRKRRAEMSVRKKFEWKTFVVGKFVIFLFHWKDTKNYFFFRVVYIRFSHAILYFSGDFLLLCTVLSVILVWWSSTCWLVYLFIILYTLTSHVSGSLGNSV